MAPTLACCPAVSHPAEEALLGVQQASSGPPGDVWVGQVVPRDVDGGGPVGDVDGDADQLWGGQHSVGHLLDSGPGRPLAELAGDQAHHPIAVEQGVAVGESRDGALGDPLLRVDRPLDADDSAVGVDLGLDHPPAGVGRVGVAAGCGVGKELLEVVRSPAEGGGVGLPGGVERLDVVALLAVPAVDRDPIGGGRAFNPYSPRIASISAHRFDQWRNSLGGTPTSSAKPLRIGPHSNPRRAAISARPTVWNTSPAARECR